MDGSVKTAGLSIAHGVPLADESGIGALTLGNYLQEVVARFGPDEAVCATLPDGSGTVRWSYDDLWRHALEVASALIACGVGKGERVGIMVTNRPEFLSALFGTALAGGVAATLSTFSTPAELEILLRQSAAKVLIFERRILKKDFGEVLAQIEPSIEKVGPGELASKTLPFLRHVVSIDSAGNSGAIEGWHAFLSRGAKVARDLILARSAQVAPADPGVLFFSSGSTGKPKGILSAHRGVCLQLWRWKQWHNIPETVRTWCANGLFWSGSFAMFIGGTLSGGGTMILQPTFEPDEAIRLLQAERVSLLLAWPHQWTRMEASSDWAAADLQYLRYVSCLSPVCYHPTIQSDWCEPRSAYGNTETFTLISVYPVGTPDAQRNESHGIPTAGSTIKIVDPLTGEAQPVGAHGEIAVKGPTLMLGYVGIAPDDTLDAEGFLRTGDGGYMDGEGRLYWEGRLSDIIKTGGANVSPAEIDAVISRCPGVKLSISVGVPDELLGEQVVSCVVPQDGSALDEQTVRQFARDLLASYKVPRHVLFVAEEDIDLTGSAKVKSAAMRELAAKALGERMG